tara:strand:- start:9653 stop:10399 length:747 start_codon:yes stop_codon:yes gene_type:complete
MKSFKHFIKNTRFFIFLKITFILFVLLSACKKEDDVLDEELPEFGTCEPVIFTGNLSQSTTENTITYLTSGGGKIVMDQKNTIITITHADYQNFKIDLWGSLVVNGETLNSANHENLNGKHIKDRLGDIRSIIFPDGAKITMVSAGLNEQLVSVSIHDGNEYHHINFNCMTLEYSSVNSLYAQKLDDNEVDGETGTFEITETGLLFYNIYKEDVVGQKVDERVPLGEIFNSDPTRINDYYDDPRLSRT